jgi:hypothetical protein
MKKIEQVVSLLDIAQSTRMMSQMNVSVFKKEYLVLKDAIETEWNRVYGESKQVAFHDAFFDVADEPKLALNAGGSVSPTATQNILEHRSSHGHSPVQMNQAPREQKSFFQEHKGQQEYQGQKSITPTPVVFVRPATASAVLPVRENQSIHPERPKEEIKPIVRDERQAPQSTSVTESRNQGESFRREVVVGRARTEGDRDGRRNIILSLLKEKSSLNVRDIAKSLPAISEKTIQRELLAMVAEGVLLKKGERRWSVYSLRVS